MKMIIGSRYDNECGSIDILDMALGQGADMNNSQELDLS
jgi:hypothetical protein